ncbi:MAG: helicase-related protein [Nitrososphaeria archaeon]
MKQIQDRKSAILFTNTRQMAEYVATLIKAKDPEVMIEVHHGSLSRESREQTEIKLREGTAKMVVTTSSLELGIDIGSVSLVIQINSPRQAVKLLQRVGRSEHKVGGKARGLILNNTVDDYIETAAICHLIAKGELEEPLLHLNAFDVLAHHIVGLAIVYRAIEFEDVLKIARKTIFFADIDLESVSDVANVLAEIKAIRLENNTIHRGSRCFTYYFSNVSMIPENMQYTVINSLNNAKIGNVDQLFVREVLEQERPFILRGSAWNVLSIEDNRQVVKVEPRNVPKSEIPYWIGELIPLEKKTATLVGEIRREYRTKKIHM